MKILIVDDSRIYQSKIRTALRAVPWLEIVAAVGNGREALDVLASKPVDLMILDMEMPVLDGLETLKIVCEQSVRPKIIMFSSATRSGSIKTLEALSLGANDFVAKPMGNDGRSPEQTILEDLLPKIRQFLPSGGSPGPEPIVKAKPVGGVTRKEIETFLPSVIVIASSTGGPSAHDVIFRDLKGPLRCPIVIAQHMPPVFTRTFAARLGAYNGLPCQEVDKAVPLSNGVFVAPGDFHLTLKKFGDTVSLNLDQSEPRNSVRPAADNLFESAAALYGSRCMAFVLTGMGEDGLAGCRAVKSAGGGVMIQSRESCVVFGMPGAVHSAGLYDAMGSLEQIKKQLYRMVEK